MVANTYHAMEVMQYRILDALARSLGESLSIRGLAARITKYHGTGAYPNVYREVQAMRDRGWLRIDEAGRSHTVHLAFPACRDLMAQRELRRLQAFLDAQPRQAGFIEDLHAVLLAEAAAGLLVDPERGAKANRSTLLALTDRPLDLLEALQGVAGHRQVAIDAAPMTSDELRDLASMDAWSPIPDWIRGGIAFHHPQATWHALGDVKAWPHPGDAPGLDDALASLRGHGFRELGAPTSKRRVCVEEAAAQLIATREARRLAAAAVILAKNRFSPGLLHALASRRHVASESLAILRIAKPQDASVSFLEASGFEAAKIDEDHIASVLADA